MRPQNYSEPRSRVIDLVDDANFYVSNDVCASIRDDVERDAALTWRRLYVIVTSHSVQVTQGRRHVGT